jgi:hypothetical protein
MTEQEIEELEALARAATQGPWEANGKFLNAGDETLGELYYFGRSPNQRLPQKANVAYIASANPETIIKWGQEIIKLRAQINDLCDRGPRHE